LGADCPGIFVVIPEIGAVLTVGVRFTRAASADALPVSRLAKAAATSARRIPWR
jgi:hypothetical protein